MELKRRCFIWGVATPPPTHAALLASLAVHGAVAELRYVPPQTKRFRAAVLYETDAAAQCAVAASTSPALIIQLSPRPPPSVQSSKRKKGGASRAIKAAASVQTIAPDATRVVLRKKRLDDDAIATLAVALPASLTSLNLAENAITEAGCASLAKAATFANASRGGCALLISLNLANNAAGDA